jgi:hypothetical protein
MVSVAQAKLGWPGKGRIGTMNAEQIQATTDFSFRHPHLAVPKDDLEG